MKVLTLISALLFSSSLCQSQDFHWEVLPGPANATYSAMACAPNGELYVYVNADQWSLGSLLRRSGDTWSRVPLPAGAGHVTDITFGRSAVIVTIDTLVYRLSGTDWKQVLITHDTRSIVRTPLGDLLQLRGRGTAFRSQDEGETWTPIAKSVRHDSVYVYSIAECNGEYFAASDSGLYKLKDTTWLRVSPSDRYYKLGDKSTVWSHDGSIWYLARRFFDGEYSLQASSDSGRTWTGRMGYGNSLDPLIHPLPVDKNNVVLVAGKRYDTTKASFASPTHEILGTFSTPSSISPKFVVLDSSGRWYLYDEYYCSHYYRKLWTIDHYGNEWHEPLDFPGSTLEFNNSPAVVLRSFPFGIIGSDICHNYFSSDNGVHWQQILGFNKDSTRVIASMAAPGGVKLGMTVACQATCSTDGGQTWQLIDSARQIHSVAVLHDTLYVATGSSLQGTRSLLFRSTTSGRSWDQLLVSDGSSEVFGCLDSNGIVYSIDSWAEIMKRSTDYGATWTLVGRKFTNGDHFDPFLAASKNELFFWKSGFAAPSDDQDTLYRSPDGGNTWRSQHIGGHMQITAQGDIIFHQGYPVSGTPLLPGLFLLQTQTDVLRNVATAPVKDVQFSDFVLASDGSILASGGGILWRSVGDPRTASVQRAIAVRNMRMYPNPVTRTITLSGVSGPRDIQASNLLGITQNISWRGCEDGATIDVSSLTPGPYYFVIRTQPDSKPMSIFVIKE